MTLELSALLVSFLIAAEDAPDAEAVREVIEEARERGLLWDYHGDRAGFADLLEVIEQEKAGVLEPAIPDMGPLLIDLVSAEVPF